MARRAVVLDGKSLRIADVGAVARDFRPVRLSAAAGRAMNSSRRHIDAVLDRDEPVYGVNTGFGAFSRVAIPAGQRSQLQENLVKSHAVGVGPPLPTDVVRAAMVIRANALARGNSGIRTMVVQRLLDLLNQRIHPVVPSRGSLGASGDLAPLAHLTLPLLGLGHVEWKGKVWTSNTAMQRAGVESIRLQAKEGLALLNGTSFMAAIGALSVRDGHALMKDAQVAAVMSLEALLGTDRFFHAAVGRLRPHKGQIEVARTARRLLAGSEILRSHKRSDHRVQDAYALRCIPQVLGASMDVLRWVEGVISTELNSVTDNPLVLDDGQIISAGNFHGQPLAYAMDFLAIAIAEVGSIAERRVDRLVNPHLSEMQPFLVEKGGLNSGFMVAQYTAAALVSENKVLCHPASVDSIPTSGNQEDHVSMGMTAALKLQQILENVSDTVAIEYLVAAQGLDFRRPLRPGRGPAAAYRAIRARVPRLAADRVLAPDVEKVRRLMDHGTITASVVRAGVKWSN